MFTVSNSATSNLPEELKDLIFTHFVVATLEKVIFGAARQGGRIRNFIFDFDGHWIKFHKNGKFEDLPQNTAEKIWENINRSYGQVPVYTTRTLQG